MRATGPKVPRARHCTSKRSVRCRRPGGLPGYCATPRATPAEATCGEKRRGQGQAAVRGVPSTAASASSSSWPLGVTSCSSAFTRTVAAVAGSVTESEKGSGRHRACGGLVLTGRGLPGRLVRYVSTVATCSSSPRPEGASAWTRSPYFPLRQGRPPERELLPTTAYCPRTNRARSPPTPRLPRRCRQALVPARGAPRSMPAFQRMVALVMQVSRGESGIPVARAPPR